MGTVRRISALTLVVTLSLISFAIPIHAADEDLLPITINRLPLSQLLNGTAPSDPFLLAGLLEQESGEIGGIALDREGLPLANHTVRVTRVFTAGDSRALQVTGTTATDDEGRFSFGGLQASNYLLEVLRGDEVVASVSATPTESSMRVSEIYIAESAELEREGWWGQRSTAAKVGIGVALGVGATSGVLACVVFCGSH